jgi:hypothetical protein
MSHFDILLPFGLPSPHIAPDLLRALSAPALSTLLARAKAPVHREFDPFSRALPHEIWLAGQLGLATQCVENNSPALTISCMRRLRLAPSEGVWFLLQPVHIHIARDHLVLTDMRRTRLSEQESRSLFETAQPLFQEAGKVLQYGSADTWFVRADDWRGLQTATPDAACGHNIDIWMPKGEGERAWRKLQNEVQMEWHEHVVNTVRADRRLPPVNSLWLWGGADAGLNLAEKLYAHSGKTSGWAGMDAACESLPALMSTLPDPRLLVLDNLSEAALAEDWASWLENMHALEEKWFAPLLNALHAGKIDQIKLIVSHNAQLREFTVHKHSLLKFWAKPSFTRLLS